VLFSGTVCYGIVVLFHRNKQSVQILELLLNSPDYYLKYDELIFILWGKVESKGQERLIQSIKRLRESLKWCPEITIENIRKEGYRLLVKD